MLNKVITTTKLITYQKFHQNAALYCFTSPEVSGMSGIMSMHICVCVYMIYIYIYIYIDIDIDIDIDS